MIDEAINLYRKSEWKKIEANNLLRERQDLLDLSMDIVRHLDDGEQQLYKQITGVGIGAKGDVIE